MAGEPMRGQFSGMPVPLYLASPSRLVTWLDCPRLYRMTYLDRPRPTARPQRAHTSIGVSVHNALRDWWDQPVAARTPDVGARLLQDAWLDTGFRDAEQSAWWRRRTGGEVTAYLRGLDPRPPPLGLERVVAFRTNVLAFFGRVDRLDERCGQLVVVDYKTGRRRPSVEDARTSLPLALYAAAAWKMYRRRCVRVELHHVPSGTVAAYEHSDDSLERKVREAESIAADLRSADAAFAELGVDAAVFGPRVSPLCQWCDYRANCPQGQQAGPEKSSWAALEESTDEPVSDPDGRRSSLDTARGREPPDPVGQHAFGVPRTP